MCWSYIILTKIYLCFSFWDFVHLGVHPEPPCFFIKTSKILIRLNVVFEDLQLQNVVIRFLLSIKHLYMLQWKLLLISTWYEKKVTVDNSLHIRSNCWCLIMAPTKLMQYVYMIPFFAKWNLQEISIIIILIFCLNSPTKYP